MPVQWKPKGKSAFSPKRRWKRTENSCIQGRVEEGIPYHQPTHLAPHCSLVLPFDDLHMHPTVRMYL